MKTILALYTKASLKLITQFFLAGILAVLTIKLFPQLKLENDNSLMGAMIYFIGPGFFYFNSRVLVSSSLGWILLTPTKKAHILLANGIINIFKLFLALIAADALYFVYTLETKDLLFSRLFTLSPAPNVVSDETHVPATLVFVLICAATFLLLVLFGMLKPNKLRSAADYNFPKKILSLKSFFYFIGMLAFGSLLISGWDILLKYLPNLIISSLVYSAVLSSFVASTLDAIRFSDKKTKIALKTFTSSSMSMCLLLGVLAFRDINSKDLDFDSKLESFALLGPNFFGAKDKLITEMKLAPKSLTTAKLSDLYYFFSRIDKASTDEVQKTWINLCHERKDFICRYAAYTHKKSQHKPLELELLRVSCPNDLTNCFMLLQETKDIVEIESLKKHMDQICNPNKLTDSLDKSACKEYENFKRKGKK